MEIIEEKKDNIQIFKIDGRLDSNTSPELDKKISLAIDSGKYQLIVECKALEYITSAGLRVFNKTSKILKKNQGKIVLCHMEDYVREVFEIAGFDTFLPIVPTIDDALDQF